MELADLASPVRLAGAIVKQLPGLTYPVPVEDIARALDIIDIQEMTSEGFEGALLTDDAKGSGIILVRQSRYERRRFTVGHELGHFLSPHHLPSGVGFQCSSKDLAAAAQPGAAGRPLWEVEANRFAAELLMPPVLFKKDLRTSKSLDLEHLFAVASRFEVSKHACAIRAADLGDEVCAVVVSQNGVVTHVPHRGPDFPFITAKPGMQVPLRSVSHVFEGTEGALSSLDEVDPSVWLDRPPSRASLYEQVAVQRQGYRMTLLVYEKEDEDEEDEEMERRQRPRW